MFLHYTSTFDCLSLAWSYVLCIKILLYKCSFAAERTYVTMVCTFMGQVAHTQATPLHSCLFLLSSLASSTYILSSFSFPISAYCKHPGGCFGLLALISAKPDYSIPCYCNTYWTIQPHTTALANNTHIITICPSHMHITITPITAILHPRLTIPSYTLTLHSESLQK